MRTGMAISPNRITADPLGRAGSLAPRGAVLREPGEDLLVPVLAVLGLEDPVPLVREVDQLRWHVLPLQGREQLQPLADRAAEVEVVLDQQHGRLVLAQVGRLLVRGELAVPARLLP